MDADLRRTHLMASPPVCAALFSQERRKWRSWNVALEAPRARAGLGRARCLSIGSSAG